MEGKTVLVIVLLATLATAIAVAGYAADATKAKRSQITVEYYGLEPECHYPSSPAMGLAIAATVGLLLARTIITSTTGGCCSCCKPLHSMPNFGQVCIVISWILSSIAVILFIAGAKLSTQNSTMVDVNGVYYCYTVKPGIFSGAGIMGFLSVLLGLVYYFLYVLAQHRAAEKSGADLELEKPPITDVKKLPITDVKKPAVTNVEKQQAPSQN